ncbi:MAG: hypothetical protein A3I77_00880 [Gammaproteobacteria bacterium RIFCSPLOWO2_02_FULL_42_14]|nr:MAG: hypothetical protein A3B71_04670 [Gammaproteobacteria bacterium RIFCSPHIGHO2_02_FULL_42_43]OGT27480.1 MAG: hypothetical protein A2624_07270 [Gammaproteobacteria bacterium RIFCSPHIGHO2_01_FULL_42_8]OGT53156.1 MAG: hypothetical protein A3E54_08530 [Gammaproteobacteria bacterium RIFCSPHIGHO2_12_FULL_41_25]OGT60985.1 MAG: hypothetical protein A3I77_00880 [Gammaproteobacteria bacterium RIFCSPLOWO2_02_FULL_42_14]OGT85301.1 MAG: hypothetical protein A3G86_05515 [Gammaproteobacteria bacterium R
MSQPITLHFNEGKLKFSSGHFTIFSKTKREPLHGHNYTVKAQLTLCMMEPGITFDYRVVEEKLAALCQQLNWRTLIAAQSPYLKIISDNTHHQIIFNHETMTLLNNDVVLMPLDNITLETLSQWFVNQVMSDAEFVEKYGVLALAVIVFNGPYHGAEASRGCA